ncbi:acetyl/propionyl/methylcrotonyl-CoA carboxylase subunit alpha [Citromicrobium bathyomarinum]|uniref:acetyl/propionyl/methylcrotonyl-CoA carboxylase subunit alpha n=1 Tax=Citromicrobium bathyomarinum TaxID=72174 RepID=UPI00315B2DE4
MIGSILVANRGEIAVRIIRTCRLLGIRAAAVHSDFDEGALWTRLADESLRIGPAPVAQSYLDIAAIIDAARTAGVEAVHPGYGLLSENAEFARAVEEAGLVFVGPRPETIALMGDKTAARAAAIESQVPVLPGSDGVVADFSEAMHVAERIGWPVAVKASFGGGGRGIRRAGDESELEEALASAGREATAAFGRGEVFLERYVDRPRHVEVQVLADHHGNVVHLGDRDCSVQRRHQKLLEEAPAPALGDEMRDALAKAAIDLSHKVEYRGAGTVEFLVDPQREEFFFLEMNTRLQVEHGVSELVTGIDLVEQQIRVASGEPLAFRQGDIDLRGSAIQARIAAEDPWDQFRPSSGRLSDLRLPSAPWVRCDFGFERGDAVAPHYDSMFGKVLAYGLTRAAALARLGQALEELRVVGVPTTAPYLRSVLREPDFAAARHHTGSLERDWQPDPEHRPTSQADTGSDGEAPQVRQVSLPWGAQSVAVTIPLERSSTARRLSKMTGGTRERDVALAVEKDGDSTVRAPMDAVVVSLRAATGAEVAKGDTVLLLEAMKMEMEICAPVAGTVQSLAVDAGQSVQSGTVLFAMEPANATS